MDIYLFYLCYLAFMSLLTFSLYCNDKKRAIKNKWRIQEKTLLLMSFFGGAIGGIMAMYSIRHKNRKWYFVLVNFTGLIIHIALFAYFFYK